MITRADAVDDGGLLRPLRQLELEEQRRVEQSIAAMDEEFQREFGVSASAPETDPGPEPWSDFLDLSTL